MFSAIHFPYGRRAASVALICAIAQQFPLRGIDGDHLARAQPALFHHRAVIQVDAAHLGAERENAILGQLVPRRAQAVPVQAGAHGEAIGKDQRGRAVPRLAQCSGGNRRNARSSSLICLSCPPGRAAPAWSWHAGWSARS